MSDHQLDSASLKNDAARTESSQIWADKVDGKYDVSVERLEDRHQGELFVRLNGVILYRQKVNVSYGAAFGPDTQDVEDWQAICLEHIDRLESMSTQESCKIDEPNPFDPKRPFQGTLSTSPGSLGLPAPSLGDDARGEFMFDKVCVPDIASDPQTAATLRDKCGQEMLIRLRQGGKSNMTRCLLEGVDFPPLRIFPSGLNDTHSLRNAVQSNRFIPNYSGKRRG